MRRRFRCLLLLTFLLLGWSAASAVPIYSSIFVFGDSLSDGGNAFLRTGGLYPPAPYVQRISNGPVAVEYLAARLGVPPAPSLAGGTHYAVGGAAATQVPIPGGGGAMTDHCATVAYPPLAAFYAGTEIEAQVAATADVVGVVGVPAAAAGPCLLPQRRHGGSHPSKPERPLLGARQDARPRLNAEGGGR
jgi:phospholipase/lecithinase/hemolysin